MEFYSLRENRHYTRMAKVHVVRMAVAYQARMLRIVRMTGSKERYAAFSHLIEVWFVRKRFLFSCGDKVIGFMAY